MTQMTLDQGFALMSVLTTNAHWSQVDFDRIQRDFMKDPKGAGQRFTQWLANGGQMIYTQPATLQLSATFNVAEFINKDWAVWKGPPRGKGLEGKKENYEPDSLNEVKLDELLLEICLNDGESSITGETKLGRLKDSKKILLGGRAFLAFWNDYQANKENSALEWLRKTKGVTYLDFPGLIVRYPVGDRYVLYLYFRDGEWFWDCRWLVSGWRDRNFSAALASVK